MTGHGQDFAVARIECDDRARAVTEGLFGDLLQVIVNAELNLLAGNGFLRGEVSDLLADAVYDDAALAVGALQQIVVLKLQAEFAGKVARPQLAVARFDLLFADFTHVAHGVGEEASGEVTPPRNGDHFEDRNVRLMRLNKGNIGGRGVGLDNDGLEFGKIFRAVQLLFHIIQRNAQAVGDGAKMLFHLGHVVAQKQDAERGAVIDQHAAVAVEHAATRSDDRNFAYAVALSERGVFVGVDDLEFPETQQQHADHSYDDVGSNGKPRLRQSIVVPKPVRHENPRARGVLSGLLISFHYAGLDSRHEKSTAWVSSWPHCNQGQAQIVLRKFPRTCVQQAGLGNEKIFGSSRTIAGLQPHDTAESFLNLPLAPRGRKPSARTGSRFEPGGWRTSRRTGCGSDRHTLW